MSNLEEGKTPLVGEALVVYRRRWYILALFSFLALYQCCVWNTWGPVVNSVQVYMSFATSKCIESYFVCVEEQCRKVTSNVQTVYGWDTATVSLYANWGSIAFLAFMVPILYLQVKININVVNLKLSGF